MNDLEPKKSLFRLSNELLEIEQILVEQGGELTPELEAAHVKSLAESKQKVTDYCLFLDHIHHQKAFIMQQIENAESHIKRLEALELRLEGMSILALENSNKDKLEGFNGRFIGTRRSASVDIYDDTLIPKDYVKIETKEKISKEMIKEALDSGKEVPGARIIEKKNFRYK